MKLTSFGRATRSNLETHSARLIVVGTDISANARRSPPSPQIGRVMGHVAMIAAKLGVEVVVLTEMEDPVDVWVRDWGPIAGSYFIYDPCYARRMHTREAVARARQHLNRHLDFRPREIPLVLEGGNLVHNGRIALVTEKVFADNPQLSRGEIERLILTTGLDHVVFLPVEPQDEVGHADGIVKFLRPDLLLVNEYNQNGFRHYRRSLYHVLRDAKLDAELIPFPWFCTGEKHAGIWSAVGCYINFIFTPRGIIFPTFSNPADGKVARLLDDLTPLPKRAVESTALARLGGVLNCVVTGDQVSLQVGGTHPLKT